MKASITDQQLRQSEYEREQAELEHAIALSLALSRMEEAKRALREEEERRLKMLLAEQQQGGGHSKETGSADRKYESGSLSGGDEAVVVNTAILAQSSGSIGNSHHPQTGAVIKSGGGHSSAPTKGSTSSTGSHASNVSSGNASATTSTSTISGTTGSTSTSGSISGSNEGQQASTGSTQGSSANATGTTSSTQTGSGSSSAPKFVNVAAQVHELLPYLSADSKTAASPAKVLGAVKTSTVNKEEAKHIAENLKRAEENFKANKEAEKNLKEAAATAAKKADSSADDMKQRQAFLRAQRDLLIAKKKKEGEAALAAFERENHRIVSGKEKGEKTEDIKEPAEPVKEEKPKQLTDEEKRQALLIGMRENLLRKIRHQAVKYEHKIEAEAEQKKFAAIDDQLKRVEQLREEKLKKQHEEHDLMVKQEKERQEKLKALHKNLKGQTVNASKTDAHF
jgi:hypothetical protein